MSFVFFRMGFLLELGKQSKSFGSLGDAFACFEVFANYQDYVPYAVNSSHSDKSAPVDVVVRATCKTPYFEARENTS